MALVTINNVGVLSGTINMPLVGVWTADLVIDQPSGDGFEAGTQVTIESENFSLVGVVASDRSGNYLDAVHVRVLGGVGGMNGNSQARSYVQPGAFVRDVVNGLVGDAGETLSATSDQAFLATNLVAWSVIVDPISQALGTLIDLVSPGLHWRVLPNGQIWIGSETWTQSTITFDILDQDPSEGTFDIGVESPSIFPGDSLDGVGNVSRVEHQITAESIRARVWIETGEERGFRQAVNKIIDQRTGYIDYFALYDATVKSQSADLTTVDVMPEDSRVGGMQRVPLRPGLAGCQCQVANGSKLRIGWDGGDPRKPFAAIWDGGETVQRLKLAGNTNAAREGDPVSHGTLVFAFGAGSGAATLSITYNPGDGGTPQVLAAGSGTITIGEKILTGSTVVGLG